MGGDEMRAGVPSVVVGSAQATARRLQLAVALVVLNLADVLLTLAILGRGGVESNPVMRGLMAGFAAPIGLKLGVATLAGGLLLCCPADSKFADRAAAAVVGTYVAVVAWNASLLGWLLVHSN
jgi:hypothetical protein